MYRRVSSREAAQLPLDWIYFLAIRGKWVDEQKIGRQIYARARNYRAATGWISNEPAHGRGLTSVRYFNIALQMMVYVAMKVYFICVDLNSMLSLLGVLLHTRIQRRID